MICFNCGKNNIDNSNYCTNCGFDIKNNTKKLNLFHFLNCLPMILVCLYVIIICFVVAFSSSSPNDTSGVSGWIIILGIPMGLIMCESIVFLSFVFSEFTLKFKKNNKIVYFFEIFFRVLSIICFFVFNLMVGFVNMILIISTIFYIVIEVFIVWKKYNLFVNN